MNIEESINLLEWANLNKLYIETYYECDYHNIYKAIETLLTAYEKEKEKNKELQELYTSALQDWVKEKEKNKELIKQQAIEITDVGGNSIKIDLDGKIHNVYKIEEE